jgi:hypothetical protein
MPFKRIGTINWCGVLKEFIIKSNIFAFWYFPDSVHSDHFESRVIKEAVAVGILLPHDVDFIGCTRVKDLWGINEPAVVQVIACRIHH